jgi:MFS family permease
MLGIQYPFVVRNVAKSSFIIGIITSAQVIGSLAVRCNIDLYHISRLTCCFYKGLPMAPYCSDRFGRRATLAMGAVLMLGGVALQATAPTVGQFIVARTLGKADCSRLHILLYSTNFSSVGFGLIFGTISAPLLITELAYPTQVSYYRSMVVKV